MTKTVEDTRFDRWFEERCPMCGSAEIERNDWIVINDDYDEAPAGVTCKQCGYDEDSSGKVYKDAPFIMPGDPGSHDQLSDYDDD